MLDRTNGGTIDVSERAAPLDLPTLLEFRFTNVPMQRNILVLGVDYAEPVQPTEKSHAGISTHRQNVMASRLAYGPGWDNKKTSCPRRNFCSMKCNPS